MINHTCCTAMAHMCERGKYSAVTTGTAPNCQTSIARYLGKTIDGEVHGQTFASDITAFAISLPAAAPQVMPFERNPNRTDVIPVADGCGFNKYRDARGVCRRKYVFRRHDGKKPLYDVCGGLNSHRVCNLIGQCWMECD